MRRRQRYATAYNAARRAGLRRRLRELSWVDAKASPRTCRPLVGKPVVLDHDPSSLINLMLNGSIPLVAKGTPDAYRMPQFRQQLSDQDIADVITFIRNGWGMGRRQSLPRKSPSYARLPDANHDSGLMRKMR